MTRIAMWTSLGAASLIQPKQQLVDLGYSDILLQTNAVVKPGSSTFNAWPSWGRAVVDELHAVGMRVFLGCRVHGLGSPIPWYYDWCDDTAWDRYVKPAFTDFCMVVRTNGLDGIGFDSELSGNNGEWAYGASYPNPTGATREQVEQKVYERGQQLNDILAYLCGDNVEVLNYSCYWPGGYSDWLQYVAGNRPDMGPSAPTLEHQFWRGWFSRNHHGHTWFGNANFYKGVVRGNKAGVRVYPDGFDGAMAYDQRVRAWWSSFMPGQDLSRIHITPMVAVSPIEHASTSFHAAMAPTVVADQLSAAARNSDGLVIDYHYGAWPYLYDAQNIEGKTPGTPFDYAPYTQALRAAAATGSARDVELTATVTDAAGVISEPLTYTLSVRS